MPDFANGFRSVLNGLTFNNADEMEAFVRAMAQGDPSRYRALKNQINRQYEVWANRNPGTSLAGEFAGALVPGVLGAMVPGGQGATASAAAKGLAVLPRVGRAVAEPLTVAARRYAPGLAVRGKKYLPFLDEIGTGVVQSVGSADTMRDAPSQIASDLPVNAGFSLSVRGANKAFEKGKGAYQRRKGR